MHNFDEPKEWNNKCPDCRSVIKWGLTSSSVGSKAKVYCTNNAACSRVEITALKDLKICFWQGFVVRQKDGGVRFQDKDGTWIREYR
jgi:hypothetical protein